MKLSCVTASYVMDLLGYPGHFDWSAASEAILRAPILETIDDLLRRLAPPNWMAWNSGILTSGRARLPQA